MKSLKSIIAAIFLLNACLVAKAQTLPVGTAALEDYYRRAQMRGETDTNVSFTVRPINPAFNKPMQSAFYFDSAGYNVTNATNTYQSANGKLRAAVLPVSFQIQVNSHHPYGWNDGGMVPAKGLQSLARFGFSAQYGILSVQFMPEIVLAGNDEFDTYNKNEYDVIIARYYDIYNNIDLPARFGVRGINRAYWGQSSVRVNFAGLSAGISTENLWWGPGIRNSLLMSNTAPGFAHFTLNTLRPIKTPIGFFEGQLIGGKLQNSGFHPLEPDKDYFGSSLYVPKRDDWRYITGLVLTWQPKWVPGLFLGLAQTKQIYNNDLHGVKDYLPFFSSIKAVTAADKVITSRDQLSSMFMRWLWPQEKAEIYFEWGHYNYSGTFTQALLSPDDSRAYTFGLRKLMPFKNRKDENILIGVEVTQMQQTSVDKIARGEQWYVSKGIRQGYTHRGEVLGAGIGPGANMQSLEVSWVRGLKRLGLQVERYVHNNDYYYYTFTDSVDPRRHWVDLSLAMNGEWDYKKFIFNAKIMGVRSLNYQWYLRQNPGDPIWVNGANAFNLQIQTGVTYRF